MAKDDFRSLANSNDFKQMIGSGNGRAGNHII